MTRTKQAEGQVEELASAKRVAVRIRQHVLAALGTPPGWFMVQVRPLWGNYFRVNVLIGESITCFTISHSFFLLTDADGGVLDSSPEILKQY